MNSHYYAVILAGGRGERFWPLSTVARPKQFISLFGGMPLLRLAVDRLSGLVPPERILIVTGRHLIEATRESAPDIPEENIIGEPFGQDTAPACALAAGLVERRDPEGVFCILTADQLMTDIPVFQRTLADGMRLAAEQPVLITIGIRPTMPATGFGYIQSGESIEGDLDTKFYQVRRFIEKPDDLTAERYLAEGCYYWNAGMFIWHVRALREALSSHCPDLLPLLDTVRDTDPGDIDAALDIAYPQLRKISIDYALMEHAGNIVMAIGDFGWDDVGAWPALAGHFKPDADGNIIVGACEVLEATNNIVVSEPRLTALLGVKNLVVVQSEHATLVCRREYAQNVKDMVARIARRPDADTYL